MRGVGIVVVVDIDDNNGNVDGAVVVTAAVEVGGYVLTLDFELGKIELVLSRAGLAGTEMTKVNNLFKHTSKINYRNIFGGSSEWNELNGM